MLHSLRRSSTSLFAWLLLGALALVFGLSFGLPSDTLSLGAQPLASVHGQPISRQDYTYQLSTVGVFLGLTPDERLQQLLGVREEVLDSIVERLVLGEVAQSIGLRALERQAEELTADGHLIVLGDTRLWLGDRKFNYNNFAKGLLGNLQVSPSRYLEFQRQELLARSVRDLLAASTVVSQAQIRETYDRDANQISLRYARFSSTTYADLVDPTPAEVDAYLLGHRDDLAATYKSEGARFSKLAARSRVRIVRVDLPQPLAEDADGTAKSTRRQQAQAARTTISAARTRILRGESFADVARALSQDHATAGRGGDLGWINVAGTGSGQEQVVDDAATALAPGQTSGVVEGEEALYLVRLVGAREAGDVSEAEALRELAEARVRQERGGNLARQAANEALLALKHGKTMRDVFRAPGGANDATTPIEDLLENAITRADATQATKANQAVNPPTTPGLPQMKISGLFAKNQPVPGLGAAATLTDRAWNANANDEVMDKVFDVGSDYVIAGVEDRKVGDDEGFAAAREEITRRLVAQKSARVTQTFARRRCLEAKARGDITVDQPQVRTLLTYNVRDEKAAPPPAARAFSICDRVGSRGGLLRQARLFGG
ncbi:MAG: SurA N-terminal domain-containing protein [Nannocystaceae bacterium]